MRTTAGYDSVIQIAENVLDRAVKAVYLNERIPHTVSKQFNYAGFKGQADVIVKAPSLRLDVAVSGLSNPIELTFPVRPTVVVTSPTKDAFTTDMVLKVTAEVENASVEIGKGTAKQTLYYVDISFANVPQDQFVIEIASKKYAQYGIIVKYVLMQMLKKDVVSLALAPPLSSSTSSGKPSIAAYRAQVYNDSSTKDLDTLDLLVNFAKKTAPKATITPFIKQAEDFAVAIDSSVFDEQVTAALAKKFPSGFPAKLPEDESVSLNSLSISLADGYVAVAGSATKAIDCWWDADVDFSGKAFLYLDAQGKLTVTTKDVDLDLPWWADALQFLLPGIGSVIVSSLGTVFGFMVGQAIASQAKGLLGDLTVFAEDLPSTATSGSKSAPKLKARNTRILPREDALVLGGSIVLFREGEADGEFVGNTKTKELHLDSCRWRHMMNPRNERLFEGIAEPLGLGYNGCWYCLNWYDTDQFTTKSST